MLTHSPAFSYRGNVRHNIFLRRNKMEKTKFGMDVCLLAAAAYFLALFGGYVPVLLVAGYVLLMEEDAWLKKCAVKAVGIMVIFSVANLFIGLIPNAISLINYIFSAFGGSFYIGFVSNLVSALSLVLAVVQKLLLVFLGLKALKHEDIPFETVDKLVEKYM